MKLNCAPREDTARQIQRAEGHRWRGYAGEAKGAPWMAVRAVRPIWNVSAWIRSDEASGARSRERGWMQLDNTEIPGGPRSEGMDIPPQENERANGDIPTHTAGLQST